MQRFVVAFVGSSGSGKTSLIERLVQHYTRRGRTVGVIKHTHHELNREHRGDTARVLDAGATIAVLASDTDAVVFSRDVLPASRPHERPNDLLDAIDAQVIFVEGFKGSVSPASLSFDGIELAGVVEFVDRIPGR